MNRRKGARAGLAELQLRAHVGHSDRFAAITDCRHSRPTVIYPLSGMAHLPELPMRAGQLLKREHGEPLPRFGIDKFTLLERSEVVFGLVGRI